VREKQKQPESGSVFVLGENKKRKNKSIHHLKKGNETIFISFYRLRKRNLKKKSYFQIWRAPWVKNRMRRSIKFAYCCHP
jgi:hypothetical protein